MLKINDNNVDKCLIVVTGISSSGKSTLSRKLRDKLNDKLFVDLFSVDNFKEEIYEEIGFRNEIERQVLKTYALSKFKTSIICSMRKNVDVVIIEYVFDLSWQEFFNSVCDIYGYTLVIINCISRSFEDIWESKVKRDSNFNVRPKCLTAGAYIKDKLFVPKADLYSDEYKEIHRVEYNTNLYTSLEGDYIINDNEALTSIYT